MNIYTDEEIAQFENIHEDGHDFYIWPNGGGKIFKKAIKNIDKEVFISSKSIVWGGTIEGGTIEGGTIRDGIIRGGIIRDGTIEGGTIEGGTILSNQSFVQFHGLGEHCLTAMLNEGEIFITKGCFSGNIESARKVAAEKYDANQIIMLESVIKLIELHFQIYPNG
jgi:hypothetical protein